jgi:hypothetical protein
MIWFRSANSHTGPQLHRCIRGRTDGSIRQRANPPKKPLALGGASTDEYTLLANNSAGSIPTPIRKAKLVLAFMSVATEASCR